MKIYEIEKVLGEKFPGSNLDSGRNPQSGGAWSVGSSPISQIREAARVFDDAGFFLETITALDFQDTFELVYHFNCYEPRIAGGGEGFCAAMNRPLPPLAIFFAGPAGSSAKSTTFSG